jgi:hypothetical protein
MFAARIVIPDAANGSGPRPDDKLRRSPESITVGSPV